MQDSTITLRDGRTLAYCEFGDARGTPAFYFHGTPGSRIEAEFLHAAAVVARVRLIGTDRPGFGKSDFLKKRQFLDWPDDVAQLADHLGLDRFAVVGLSGGGPHVAACAVRIPERLIAACVVSGAVPREAALATTRGWLRRAWYRFNYAIAPLWARPLTAYMAFWTPRLPASRMPRVIDKRVMARPRVRDQMKRIAVEAFRNGSRGAAHEFKLHARPWRIDPATVPVGIDLWHGDDDRIVRIEGARWLAERYRECRPTWLHDEGHLMIVDHAEDVMRVVAEAAHRSRASVG